VSDPEPEHAHETSICFMVLKEGEKKIKIQKRKKIDAVFSVKQACGTHYMYMSLELMW